MNSEDAATLRGLAVRAVVHTVDDAAGSQALVVETHEGVVRSAVPVLQPYGLASRPAPGGLTVLLAIGGDHGDMVALPSAGGARLAVETGETALYTDEGTRVHLRAGGPGRGGGRHGGGGGGGRHAAARFDDWGGNHGRSVGNG